MCSNNDLQSSMEADEHTGYPEVRGPDYVASPLSKINPFKNLSMLERLYTHRCPGELEKKNADLAEKRITKEATKKAKEKAARQKVKKKNDSWEQVLEYLPTEAAPGTLKKKTLFNFQKKIRSFEEDSTIELSYINSMFSTQPSLLSNQRIAVKHKSDKSEVKEKKKTFTKKDKMEKGEGNKGQQGTKTEKVSVFFLLFLSFIYARITLIVQEFLAF